MPAREPGHQQRVATSATGTGTGILAITTGQNYLSGDGVVAVGGIINFNAAPASGASNVGIGTGGGTMNINTVDETGLGGLLFGGGGVVNANVNVAAAHTYVGTGNGTVNVAPTKTANTGSIATVNSGSTLYKTGNGTARRQRQREHPGHGERPAGTVTAQRGRHHGQPDRQRQRRQHLVNYTAAITASYAGLNLSNGANGQRPVELQPARLGRHHDRHRQRHADRRAPARLSTPRT